MSHGLFITGAALLALAGPADAQDSFGAPAATPPRPPAATAAPAAARPPVAADTTTDTSAETRDDGVPPPRGLHSGAMHGPTPASIPGGRLITTPALVALLRQAAGEGGAKPLVLDVLGGPEALPGAQYAVPAHQSGSFDDRTQREFGQYLQQATQGRPNTPLVFYCASTQCWMSYNAALRAIALGYRQVLWYRGGLQAWKQAGQPVQQR
jgi:PQQ-dependent catabolism-associated CXXCW motif protein